MKNSLNPLYSTSTAILAGALIVAISVLMHGGIIKLGKGVSAPSPAAPAAGQPVQPQVQGKTEADIVKGLKTYAGKAGLDQGKFDSCLDSGSKASAVSKDLADGTAAGVNGTPAFFVNGRIISGAVPFEQFKTVIDEEIQGSAATTVTRQTVAVGDLPVLGKESAKVTLIEFSDYECPFCERHFSQTEPQLKKDYIDKGLVKFYYRDFPLTSIHPGAQKAAEAARCANDQGKYWEYHDIVFSNRQAIF
ncbi:MAG: DSBA oxidoreductase family protein [Microgenomates group bacterium Gr01-1014_7]|nr:MAG: DSBA oxidoreductase family protein [Microgenomates group bacterium Gr01-1014_7]